MRNMPRHTPEERETTIVWDQATSKATISTAGIRLIHHLTRLGVKPERTTREYGRVVEAEYTVPRSWIRVSPPHRRTSPAQRAAARRSIASVNARRSHPDAGKAAP